MPIIPAMWKVEKGEGQSKEKAQNPIWKITKEKQMEAGSSGRSPAWQAKGQFNLQYCSPPKNNGDQYRNKKCTFK
jgi:hypothetical protein